MVGHQALLGLGHDGALLLGAGHDALQRVRDLLLADLLQVAPRRQDSRLRQTTSTFSSPLVRMDKRHVQARPCM